MNSTTNNEAYKPAKDQNQIQYVSMYSSSDNTSENVPIQYVSMYSYSDNTSENSTVNDYFTSASTCLCNITNEQNQGNPCFDESTNFLLIDKEMQPYIDIANSYGVLSYFNGKQSLPRYINVALSNRQIGWFEWVCQCLSNEKLKDKIIGIINENDLTLKNYLAHNSHCYYLALRRGAKKIYICYFEKCVYKKNHIKRQIIDIFSGCKCEINPGVTLTVVADSFMVIQSELKNEGTVIVENNACLVQVNDF
ncbi:hypothetical protein EON71_01330, partial [bacterium]